MGGRRPRSATAEATKWSAAAIASLGLMAAPLGRLVSSGAEAFVFPAMPPTIARVCCSKSAELVIEQAWIDHGMGAGVTVFTASMTVGTSHGWGTKASRRAAGTARWGQGCRTFGLGASPNDIPESEWAGDMSGMREDEKFPDKPSAFSAASADQEWGSGGGQEGDEERGFQEEDGGSWNDAEVERRVAERRGLKVDPYAAEEEKDQDDGEGYLEVVVNMTKPLGITIEASTDKAKLIYITSVGEQAEARGLEVGDVLTGVSAVFGDDVWSVKSNSIDKVRSLVRCRREPYVLVRVERGHISLEERCKEGFGVMADEDCWRITEDGECEVGYSDLWTSVYEEELAVLQGGSETAVGGRGGGEKKVTNEPPPTKKSSLGWDDSWMENNF